jgi:hypothetical protein
MSVRRAVRLALRTQLRTIAGLPPLVWEGIPTPPPGTLHLRETVVWRSTDTISSGPNAMKRAQVIYQLLVRAPMQRPAGVVTPPTPNPSTMRTAEDWADVVCAAFEPGRAFVHDGRRVLVLTASSGTAISRPPDWTDVPVAIGAQCDFVAFT